MHKRSWFSAAIVAGAATAAVALMGFAPMRREPGSVSSPTVPHLTQTKLAFNYMTPEQVADLWRRADRYAEAEAFLKKCGQPSNIERRMWQAVGPCIEDVALRKVATYFRAKVLHFGQQRQFVCHTPEAKKVLNSVRAKIDADVEEVRGMCAACIIC